jgi:3-methyladenine DNA glycosylase AlkD
MNKTEVMALLKGHTNERGVEHWKRLAPKGSKIKSFGIGLTMLRKLAKQVGRDHDLAMKLWASDNYDAKVMGLLIDDPKTLTREQVEKQVEQLQMGMLSHVFASCDATLGKSPIAVEVADEWMDSKHDMRRRCGFLLLYELSKDKRKSAPDDAFFARRIVQIEKTVQSEENWVRDAMWVAMLGMGKRNKALNKSALRVAKAVGPLKVDYGDNSCEALDLVKHLGNAALKKRLGA